MFIELLHKINTICDGDNVKKKQNTCSRDIAKLYHIEI